MTLLRPLPFLLAAALAAAFPACTDTPVLTAVEITEDYSHIEDPHERWQAYGIDSYRIEQGVSCFCPLPVSWTAFVENGEVVDVEVDTKGFENPDEIRDRALARAFTVEEAFEIAARGGEGAFQFTVEYDERYGFPKHIFIDWAELMVDEEIGYGIDDVKKLVRN